MELIIHRPQELEEIHDSSCSGFHVDVTDSVQRAGEDIPRAPTSWQLSTFCILNETPVEGQCPTQCTLPKKRCLPVRQFT